MLPVRKGDKSLDDQTCLEVSLLRVEGFKGLVCPNIIRHFQQGHGKSHPWADEQYW